MNLLFQNDYQAIYLHPRIWAFEQRFTAESVNLSSDGYMDEMRIFGRQMEINQTVDKKIEKLIINILEGGPSMEPKVQNWMYRYFYPLIAKTGIRYKAYCMGDEILAKLSIELTAEDDPNDYFSYQYFNSYEAGFEWLRNINKARVLPKSNVLAADKKLDHV